MNRFKLSNARGFTLIEMLVVLVIVAVIGVGSYALLDIFVSSDQSLNRRAEALRRLSIAMYRLEDDLRQLTARPIKDAYAGYRPAFVGSDTEFEFTRLGSANLLGEPRGTLQRLHYATGFLDRTERARRAVDSRFADEDSRLLLRRRWRVLDPGPESEAIEEPLLADVEALRLRYLDPRTDAWLAQWPPLDASIDTSAPDTRLPRAVEITLVPAIGEEIRRTFLLPDTRIEKSDQDNGDENNDGGNNGDNGGAG